MKDPVIVVGIGELGSVFARGLLRLGHPVYPLTRGMEMARVAAAVPKAPLVLVAVGENDLHPTLEQVPDTWRNRIGLLQNELLPRDWQAHGMVDPTVIAVWFEKKKGQDVRVLIPSPVSGPSAGLLVDSLATLDIPARELASAAELEHELVRKNVYILTTNIAGLVIDGTVEDLWHRHQDLARAVADEVMDIQAWLVGRDLDRPRLIKGLIEGIEGDLQHRNRGRSAPDRLRRALGFADEAGLAVPRLREIQSSLDA